MAVAAFLGDRINWCDIVAVVASAMDHYEPDPLESVGALYENDEAARRWATASLKN